MTTLARRFIMICLLFTIFALLLAAAVANSDRSRQDWQGGLANNCAFGHRQPCRLFN